MIDGLKLLTKKATDFSFPSGHSASAFAAAAAICKTQKGSKWRWIVLIGAVCMALSRLYIGIHYPSDVICGALSGTLCGLAAAFLHGCGGKTFQESLMRVKADICAPLRCSGSKRIFAIRFAARLKLPCRLYKTANI